MSTTTIAGLPLIAVPLAFNAAFALLAARFDHPDILRRPTADVLAAFRAGGTSLALRGRSGLSRPASHSSPEHTPRPFGCAAPAGVSQ